MDAKICDECDTRIGEYSDYVEIRGHGGSMWSKWHLCHDCAKTLYNELEDSGEEDTANVIRDVLGRIRELCMKWEREESDDE